jgi:hypothetical protein
MKNDKLTEFEQIEFYKKRLKGKTGFTIVVAVLMFLIGFLVAKFIYQ